MNEPHNPQHIQQYKVQIGHHRLRLEGASREEAIAQARRMLAHDMPRLWDVIHNLEESRFTVRDANPQRNLFQ